MRGKIMNIYQPYEELADKSDVLHLKLSDARDRMLFVTYRAIPIGLTLMVWYILQQKRAEIPMGFNYTLIGVSVALIVWLFFRSYTCEIKIAAGKIFLLRKTITGVKEINMD
ncbi:MAG TPA: hypothetical protein VHB48_12315, partial [Chitinophagaceae bacterium]|nr:hypothetical protein [Chitinophagaceae bacterium]